MIVDTSVVIATLWDEPEADQYLEAMIDADSVRISAASYLEAAIVVDARKDPATSRRLDELLVGMVAEIVPVTAEQARIARDAYRDFGKGSGHPARLNVGDCFSYALASITGEPLLYKGEDFAHTDLRSALEA